MITPVGTLIGDSTMIMVESPETVAMCDNEITDAHSAETTTGLTHVLGIVTVLGIWL